MSNSFPFFLSLKTHKNNLAPTPLLKEDLNLASSMIPSPKILENDILSIYHIINMLDSIPIIV